MLTPSGSSDLQLFPSPSPSPTSLPPIPHPEQAQPPRKWPEPSEPSPTAVPDPARIITDQATWTFLLLGSDRRSTSFRTDAILLLAVRPWEGTVSLISFPRDLYVYIPGWRMQRLNSAYYRGERSGYPGGGPQLIRDTFLYNFGIRVDSVALIHLQGFREMIDALGGIWVPVACPYTDWRLKSPDLNPNDPENWELYTVEPGLVWMDGDMALWYVRARKRSSDFNRHRRQQAVLLALRNRLLEPENWRRLPTLYRILRQYVETDLTWTDVLPFLPLLPQLDLRNMRFYRIRPPLVEYWRTPEGASVLLPRRGKLLDMLEEALGPQPERQWDTPPPAIVAVRNAAGRKGWDVLAAWRLGYGGYATEILEPYHRKLERSRLYPLHGQGPEQARELLRLLRLPEEAWEPEAPPELIQDVRADWLLLVGHDYNPCFDPTR